MELVSKRTFTIPVREDVSPATQVLFDKLHKSLGFMPNLPAFFAKSETGLIDYMAFQNRKTSLSGKEKEVVNLVTSQINGCRYCQSAHTLIGKLHGFTDEQILEIRKGTASFDPKLDTLAKFTAAVVNNKGHVVDSIKEEFFAAGYTDASLVDVIIIVGDKIISNYLHNLTQLPIDFPLAKEL